MKAKGKIVFIDILRGIATLFVLLSHLGFVFWYSNASVANLLHIEERENIASTVPRIYGDIATAIMEAQLNLGMIGVACFFLISGFIIPHSVDRIRLGGGGGESKLLFLIKRIVRIWPIYILGFGFVFIFLQFYGKAVSGEWLFTMKDFFIQSSLMSDWLRVPSIDGISWTLEIELKFYALFYLFYILKCEDNPKVIAGTGILILILQILYNDINAGMIFAWSDTAYFFCSNLVNASMYMIYILMGTALYHLYASKWEFKVWVVVEQILLICFLAAIPYSSLFLLRDKCIINYGVALLLFFNMYMLRDRITSNKILSFWADNSFSIYLLHGVSGYILLTIFYDMGIPMYINLPVVMTIVLFAAWLFHKYIEEPVGRLLKKWVIDRLTKPN